MVWLHKEYNKYHLKYLGSKGLVSSSSSFFPKCIWAAERRGQVTPATSTDQVPSPKCLRQLQKVFSISLRKSVPNIIIIRDYLQRNVSLSISLELKKVKKYFTRIGVSIWNSIPHSVETLNLPNFRKKIKSLLLNTLDNEDNYLNVTYLKNRIFLEVNLICCIYLHCNFSLYFSNNKPFSWVCVKGFSFYLLLYFFSFNPFFLIWNLITPLFIIFVLPRLAL